MYELKSTTANEMRDEIVAYLHNLELNYLFYATITITSTQKRIYEANAKVLETAATILKDAKVVVL